MKNKWKSCQANIPGYALTYGQLAHLIKDYASKGEFPMAKFYLELAEKHGAMAGIINASKEGK